MSEYSKTNNLRIAEKLQLRNRESDLLFNNTIASTVENNNLDPSIIPKFNKWTENVTRFLEKNIVY